MTLFRRVATLVAALCVLAASPLPFARAQGPLLLPPDFEAVTLLADVVNPNDFVFAPDGRMLVARSNGLVIAAGPNGPEPGNVIDLRSEVWTAGDRGLLAINVHPGFVPDGGPTSWMYLYFTYSPVPNMTGPNGTDDEASMGRLVRYRVVDIPIGQQSVLRADLGSRQVLLGERLPDGRAPTAVACLFDSHNGGSIVWGSDGTLLLSTGDGGDWFQPETGGNQPWGFDDFIHPVTGLRGPLPKDQDCGSFRSQDLRSLAGKVLRIDPETGLGIASNPFYDGDPDSVQSRVWSLGLRNAFRMERVPGTGSSDPSAGDPGVFLLADVGSSIREELNVVRGGENFGWPCFEHTTPVSLFQNHTYTPNPFAFPSCASPVVPYQAADLAYARTNPGDLFPLGLHQSPDGVALGGFNGLCAIGGTFYTGGGYPAHLQGAYFFSDFGFGWIKAARFDAGQNLEVVQDFATAGAGRVVSYRIHPTSGNLTLLDRGFATSLPGRVVELRWTGDPAPIASFTATTAPGPQGLTVDFDAAASNSPVGLSLSYTWDFGDGTPLASGVQVQHTFGGAGLYLVRLTVEDSSGAQAQLVEPVVVGPLDSAVAILSPSQGETFAPGETVQLVGFGQDKSGNPLNLEWRIDAFVNGVWTQDAHVIGGSPVEWTFPTTASEKDMHTYRVRLVGSAVGLSDVQVQRSVHPEARVVDLTGTALPIAKVFGLDPPGSQGFGNPDVEVWRDLGPAPGEGGFLDQFATFHPQNVGADWMGYEFPTPLPGTWTYALEWTLGEVVPEGGWVTLPRIQARVNGQWSLVANLQATPSYPIGTAPASFATYRFSFDPVEADAVRLLGIPGGSEGFLSAAELRVLAIAPPAPLRDITGLAAAPLSHLLELSPPGPQRFGSLDLGRIGDGAEPAAGSTSIAAQVSGFHAASDPSDEQWFGWRYQDLRTFSGLRFREGLVWRTGFDAAGGWFEDLRVETRLDDTAPWIDVTDLVSSPPYRTVGPDSPSYEAYTLVFEPTVARQIRVIGTPGGELGFASVSELRVFEPHGFDGGWQTLSSLGLEADVLFLAEPGGPPGLGLPLLLETAGAEPGLPGILGIAAQNLILPLGFGTLHLNPGVLLTLPQTFDALGVARKQLSLPSDAALAGVDLSFQSFALSFVLPGGIAFSNGLRAVITAE
jgi:glucose/arabinose dehydrogenase/PKD repeat protein